MIDLGRHNVLGVMISAVDYEAVVERVVAAARARRPLAVSALAVHGVMTGAQDEDHRARLNRLDILTPDGQPVRWALAWLHGVRLAERVYGPDLTLRVCAAAAAHGLPVYFYGSRPDVLAALVSRLQRRFPDLKVAGTSPSRFRRLDAAERDRTAAQIKASGARILFVGLGCPRQEAFAYDMRDAVGIPLLAVGAAFDFHAGLLPQAPTWMQRRGLEWLFRLVQEPRRLWRRYLYLNSAYSMRLLGQRLGLHRPQSELPAPLRQVETHG
jgi:exopolysaccharide biosynthesis WecB/TagA/CpsF family protein